MHVVSSFEVPPPSKRVRTMDDEGVEQLQPTALDSEETTTTGEGEQERVLWCTCSHAHVLLYPNHIPHVQQYHHIPTHTI